MPAGAGGRVTRGSAAAADDLASLNVRDRLILAQAVYEYGAKPGTWAEIAKLLSTNKLITKTKHAFTAQSCSALHAQLMKEAGIEWDETCTARKSMINFKLAQRYFKEHAVSLRNEIAAEEARFKAIAAEIEEIRSGKWDDRIKAKLRGEKVSLDMPPLNSPVIVIEDAPMPKSARKTREDEKALKNPAQELQIPPDPSGTTSTDAHLSPLTPLSKIPSTSGTQRARGDPEQDVSIPATLTVDKEEDDGQDDGDETKTDEGQGEDVTDAQANGDIIDNPTPGQTEIHEDNLSEQSRESTPVVRLRRKAHKRGASEAETDAYDSSREKKRVREESEPVDEADSPAPNSTSGTTKGSRDRKRFQNMITMLHSQIVAHRNGTIFHNPIKASDAPDYHDIVKRPMDLKTIKNRVRDGLISSSAEYQRDVYLMFANSLMYNKPDSDIYKMAEEMMLDSEKTIQNFQATENFNARQRG